MQFLLIITLYFQYKMFIYLFYLKLMKNLVYDTKLIYFVLYSEIILYI